VEENFDAEIGVKGLKKNDREKSHVKSSQIVPTSSLATSFQGFLYLVKRKRGRTLGSRLYPWFFSAGTSKMATSLTAIWNFISSKIMGTTLRASSISVFLSFAKLQLIINKYSTP